MDNELQAIEAELAALGQGTAPLETTPTATSAASPLQQSLISGAKNVGGLGASLAGSLAGAKTGAALGAPLAPFTAGLSVPVGGILGGAVGGFGGDVAFQSLANLVGGVETPFGDIATESAKAAGVGAGLEAGLRGLGYIAPPGIRLGANAASWAGSKLRNAFGPKTVSSAADVAADTLQKLGVTSQKIQAGLEVASDKTKATLFEVVPTKEIARAQAALSESAYGAETFTEIGQAQANKIANTLNKLVPSKIKDLTTEEIGTKLSGFYEKLRNVEFEKAKNAYNQKGLLDTKISVKGLDEALDKFIGDRFGTIDAADPTVQQAVRRIKAVLPGTKIVTEQKPMGFGVELGGKAATKTRQNVPLKTLHEVRSQLLEEARSRKSWGTNRDVYQIVQRITDTINASKAGPKLTAANVNYKNMFDKWFRSDLAKALDAPDAKVITNLSKSGKPIEQFEETFGPLVPKKQQQASEAAQLFIAGKTKELALQQEPKAIANWIAKNENALKRTGVWSELNTVLKAQTEAKDFAFKAQNAGLQKQTLQEAGLTENTLRALATKPGEMPRMPSVQGEAGQQTGQMLKGALRTTAQNIGGTPLGQAGITTTVAGISGIPMNVAIPLAAGVGTASFATRKARARGQALVGDQLTKAFSNPRYAAKLLREKAKRDAEALIAFERQRVADRQFQQIFLQTDPLATGLMQQYGAQEYKQPQDEMAAIEAELATLGEQ